MDVCDGLLFCHRGCGRGPTAVLLHRDVKPSNVLLHRDRMGRLTGALGDFGIAKLYPVGVGAAATTATLYGTAGYIAPELTEGAHPSPLSDAYALGVTVLQVGGGRRQRHPSQNPAVRGGEGICAHLHASQARAPSCVPV